MDHPPRLVWRPSLLRWHLVVGMLRRLRCRNRTAFLPLPYLLFLFCFLNPVALYALEAIIRSEGHVPFSLAVQSSLNVGSYRQIDDTGWRIANRRRERETEHDIALGSVKVAVLAPVLFAIRDVRTQTRGWREQDSNPRSPVAKG
jgi:hypothetical protein